MRSGAKPLTTLEADHFRDLLRINVGLVPMPAERSLPAYMPVPAGRVTHYVGFDQETYGVRGISWEPTWLPCYGEKEARQVEMAQREAGKRNVRVLSAEQWRAKGGLS